MSAQLNKAPEITLSNPYNTMYVHLHYLQEASYEPSKAAETIYPDSDSLAAIDHAIKLKQILDAKGLYVYLNQIPQKNDYLDSTSQQHHYYPFVNELPGLYLEQYNNKWYYSKWTIDHIPKMYKDVFPYGTDRIANLLPKTGQRKFLGLAIWQYLGLFILLAIGFIIHFILARLVNLLEGLVFKGWVKKLEISKEHLWSIAKIISLLFVFKIISILLPVLRLPASYASFGIKILNIITICLLAFLIIRFIR
ncbi:MAG: hypothetical protein AAGK97_08430, partial [Bacteroidota bacterium]